MNENDTDARDLFPTRHHVPVKVRAFLEAASRAQRAADAGRARGPSVPAQPSGHPGACRFAHAGNDSRRVLLSLTQTGHAPPCSLDHLVGAQQKRLGDFQTERLGGGQIDDEIEFGRLFTRDRHPQDT